ncbi:MAG: FkbM family methyltransferase [Sphingomonas sp.]|nr:FkbM family methyltransferase [Sphingomonas sp.]
MMVDHFFARLANRLGYRLEAKTDPARIKAFVNRMRPMIAAPPLVRLGGAGDGGYLVPDDLSGIDACFSPGVSTSSSFEHDLYERAGIRSFLADWSVESPAINLPESVFLKKYLGIDNDDQFITLDDWVRSSVGDQSGDLILQMDIEGAEYQVLYRTPPALLARFRIIVIELHGLNRWTERPFFDFAEGALGHLLSRFTCVHLHPNNYCENFSYAGIEMPWGIEATFLRNDRVGHGAPATAFPHPLDVPNFSDRPDIALPRWWYEDGQI